MSTRRRHVTFAAFSCTHCPLHSEQAHAALLAVLRDVQPEYVIHLGDLFEASHASVHPDEHEHDALDEYQSAAAYLDTIIDATPGAQRVWCLGNHDDNIQRRDARRVPAKYRRAVHWSNSPWKESFAVWRQVPYVKDPRGFYQLGQVIFSHGFDAGASSDELEAIQLANLAGGFAHTLVIRGHTHRPEQPTQCRRTKRIPLPFWYANAGTLCDIERMDYAARVDTSAWGAAVVVGTTRIGRACQPARNWRAETIMLNYPSSLASGCMARSTSRAVAGGMCRSGTVKS
jgi:predicted phosphodiesterase